MAMSAARWNTRSCPRMAVRTPLGSRTSPMKMSISFFDLCRKRVDPAQRTEGIVQAEGADLLAALDEFFGQVAADETVGAGDEYSVRHNKAPFL